jgi:hypothetical protein
VRIAQDVFAAAPGYTITDLSAIIGSKNILREGCHKTMMAVISFLFAQNSQVGELWMVASIKP